MSSRIVTSLLALVLSTATTVALAEPLITSDEAHRPDDPAAQPSRGITRGPTVKVETGAPRAGTPFDFRIDVTPHGGATVDPADIHVIYLKVPAVDLTDRLKPYRTADGFEMKGAEAPAGNHPLKIEVKDSEGHETSTVVRFDVAATPTP